MRLGAMVLVGRGRRCCGRRRAETRLCAAQGRRTGRVRRRLILHGRAVPPDRRSHLRRAKCVEPKDLLAHGVTPDAGAGPHLFAFLGGRYRVVYDIAGEAPISEAKFDYLAQDLPLAAKLASRSRRRLTRCATWMPPRSASMPRRGDNSWETPNSSSSIPPLKDGSTSAQGHRSSAHWRFRGSAYVDIRIRPGTKGPGGVAYDVRIRTAPVNAMVNAIMRLGPVQGPRDRPDRGDDERPCRRRRSTLHAGRKTRYSGTRPSVPRSG